MDISDWIAIGALAISGVSAFFSCRANEISKEANKMSKKSISIDYDATFNAFFIQVKKSYEDVLDLKSETNIVKGQPKEFTITKFKYIEETFKVFPSLDMKKTSFQIC